MAYQPEILIKEIYDGKLHVRAKFTDPANPTYPEFIEDFFTDGDGDNPVEWMKYQVKRRCLRLDNIHSVTIPTGTVNLTGYNLTPQYTAAEIEYRDKLDTYHSLTRAVSLGIVDATATQYVNLKTWLKNNFTADMVKFF